MKIILFTHPSFIEHQSMPRYANMLVSGMLERGHEVEVWSPEPFFVKLTFIPSLKKWLSYVDQFVLFPLQVNKRLKYCAKETIFVFADQALGPWVPLVANRLHVIHCHDFLAQQSAKGEFKENIVSWSGKIYQNYIHKGYTKGKNFISISKKTQEDLHNFLEKTPPISKVVNNGLNQKFEKGDSKIIREKLTIDLKINLSSGYVLHVGGNQFYKNRKGVIEIYIAWRKISQIDLPLLLIGSAPTIELEELRIKSSFANDIHFLTTINDILLVQLYQGASVLLFPSLAEGFGWPIAEAMASGCLVITTNEAPMTEVGGKAAFYINKRPSEGSGCNDWAQKSALMLKKVIEFNSIELKNNIDLSTENASRFNTENALNQIETIYKEISNSSN